MLETSSTDDRRRFQRVLFDAPITLSFDGTSVQSRLIDLSLKGALFKVPEAWPLSVGSRLELNVDLNEKGTNIRMQARIAHMETEHVGCICDQIDMDSITHLRRLVELNLGDGSLLERDLQALG